jgi:hypothetical protein
MHTSKTDILRYIIFVLSLISGEPDNHMATSCSWKDQEEFCRSLLDDHGDFSAYQADSINRRSLALNVDINTPDDDDI